MGNVIGRDLQAAQRDEYDVIVVGGGIYGACTLLEATRRGLRGLLVERDDFGGATSWNSLRILHGGLRYLQTLDLARFRQSVDERRWFCRSFPEHVEPLPCLMPLYSEGLKRPGVMRLALGLNNWLSQDRNAGVGAPVHIPSGRLLSAGHTVEKFPGVPRQRLRGGALWYDAVMKRPQRVLIDLLRWAAGLGATALNYVNAVEVLSSRQQVAGILATDGTSGDRLEFRGKRVINCAGPWSQEFVASLDAASMPLFEPSLAWNVLLRTPPPAPMGVAVSSRRRKSPIYFLLPWNGMTLAGTVHGPWNEAPRRLTPEDVDVSGFLGDLEEAIPSLCLAESDVVRTYAGLLPARRRGTARLSKRPVIRAHGRGGGLEGLISVVGVKYTTARRVAEQALTAADASWGQRPYLGASERADVDRSVEIPQLDDLLCDRGPATADAIRRLVRDEAVVYADDLILRRTDWGEDPEFRAQVEEAVGPFVVQRPACSTSVSSSSSGS